MVANKNDKCMRFEDGLNPSIKVLILASAFNEFGRVVHAAKSVEKSLEEDKYLKARTQARRGYFKVE